MSFFPIVLDLAGRRALVIGGGKVAARKVQDVLAAGGRVRVVARALDPLLRDLRDAGRIEAEVGAFRPECLEGAHLVFVATDDEATNRAAAEAARARGVLVNVADRPELCDFHVPAVVRRGDLLVAISTGGKSPALAARIRARLEQEFGPETGALVDLLGELRAPDARRSDLTQEERKRLYERVLDSEVPALLRAGKADEARALARKIVGGDVG